MSVSKCTLYGPSLHLRYPGSADLSMVSGIQNPQVLDFRTALASSTKAPEMTQTAMTVGVDARQRHTYTLSAHTSNQGVSGIVSRCGRPATSGKERDLEKKISK